ncbi:MAG: GxxExxY protein [Bacteroidota bacterium]
MTELYLKEEFYDIVGACMEVHNNLGSGFLEAVYQEALEEEFKFRKIPFEREKQIKISYKGKELKKYYIADFVCYDSIIVELKALSGLTTDHEAQILNYLKATNKKVGLLVNFGTKSLQRKRLVF